MSKTSITINAAVLSAIAFAAVWADDTASARQQKDPVHKYVDVVRKELTAGKAQLYNQQLKLAVRAPRGAGGFGSTARRPRRDR